MLRLFLIAIGFTALMSCSSHEGSEPIRRLDHALLADSLPDSMSEAAKVYLRVTGQSAGSYAHSSAVKAFQPIVDERIQSLDSVEKVLNTVYRRLRQQLPETPLFPIYGVILPYNQSIFFSDSMTFVGLNHYLGPTSDVYSGFPDYRKKLKRLDRLPIDLVLASIQAGYPFQGGEFPTVISRMIYDGAVLNEAAQVTGLDVETILGYDTAQTQWLIDNEPQAWHALVTNKLLYSTDPQYISSLSAPAPHATLLHPEAPGQAGSWIGARIVRKYLNKHENTPLLLPEFYNNPPKVLQQANYNGE